MNLKALVEARARAVAEMRSYLEKGDEAKFNEINAEVEKLDAQIANLKKVEDAERVQNGFADSKQPPMANIGEGKDADTEFKAKHEKAFSNYMRFGINDIASDEQEIMRGLFRDANGKQIRNAQTLTTGGGGYIIPQGFSGQLEEALKYYAGILGNVDSFSTESGNPLPWPTVNDTSNVGRILGINTAVTTTDIAFGQVMFNAYTGSSDAVLVPIQLMQDSFFNLDSEVAKLLGVRLGRLMNNKLTVGSGTNEPNGIQTATIAAGLKVTMATGQTVNFTSADPLIDVEHAVDPAYRPGAKYMLNDATLKNIKKLKDSYGRYLWLPGLAASDPNTINGYDYVINNDMPNMAANAYPLLFGEFKKYKVRRAAGETTLLRLTERYADYLQVGFIAFVRFDGQLLDAGTHPIAALQCSAT